MNMERIQETLRGLNCEDLLVNVWDGRGFNLRGMGNVIHGLAHHGHRQHKSQRGVG